MSTGSAPDLVVAVLLVVLVLGALTWALTGAAGHLDRLHHRVETSRATLDAALLRRAAATEALAASGELDLASSLLLASAAWEVTVPLEDAAREAAESDLSRALRAALDPRAVAELHRSATGRVLLADLASASQRVVLARRFANDAVSAARRMRRTRTVRWLHLAGRAPLPRTFDVDDDPPVFAPQDTPDTTATTQEGTP